MKTIHDNVAQKGRYGGIHFFAMTVIAWTIA